MSKQQVKSYSAAFKERAVKLAVESDQSLCPGDIPGRGSGAITRDSREGTSRTRASSGRVTASAFFYLYVSPPVTRR